MKKTKVFVFSISILLLLSTNVSALLVRYDVTDTLDYLGNEVCGYALIEEEPITRYV
jgi:hypothetical protein